MHQAENGDVGPDAQGEGQHTDRGKGGLAAQPPGNDREIGHLASTCRRGWVEAVRGSWTRRINPVRFSSPLNWIGRRGSELQTLPAAHTPAVLGAPPGADSLRGDLNERCVLGKKTALVLGVFLSQQAESLAALLDLGFVKQSRPASHQNVP